MPSSTRPTITGIGVTKAANLVEVALLEHCLREDLNKRSPRAIGVLRPLKVVIENYPEGQVEEMDAVNKYLAHAWNGTVWMRPWNGRLHNPDLFE